MSSRVTKPRRADRVLRFGVSLYLVGYLAHTIAHIDRGLEHTPAATLWTGLLAWALALAMAIAVFRGHRSKAAIAVGVGFATALGLAAVHFPPAWGPFSEPWRDQVGALPWASLFAALIGSVAAGIAGVYALGYAASLREVGRNG